MNFLVQLASQPPVYQVTLAPLTNFLSLVRTIGSLRKLAVIGESLLLSLVCTPPPLAAGSERRLAVMLRVIHHARWRPTPRPSCQACCLTYDTALTQATVDLITPES